MKRIKVKTTKIKKPSKTKRVKTKRPSPVKTAISNLNKIAKSTIKTSALTPITVQLSDLELALRYITKLQEVMQHYNIEKPKTE